MHITCPVLIVVDNSWAFRLRREELFAYRAKFKGRLRFRIQRSTPYHRVGLSRHQLDNRLRRIDVEVPTSVYGFGEDVAGEFDSLFRRSISSYGSLFGACISSFGLLVKSSIFLLGVLCRLSGMKLGVFLRIL